MKEKGRITRRRKIAKLSLAGAHLNPQLCSFSERTCFLSPQLCGCRTESPPTPQGMFSSILLSNSRDIPHFFPLLVDSILPPLSFLEEMFSTLPASVAITPPALTRVYPLPFIPEERSRCRAPTKELTETLDDGLRDGPGGCSHLGPGAREREVENLLPFFPLACTTPCCLSLRVGALIRPIAFRSSLSRVFSVARSYVPKLEFGSPSCLLVGSPCKNLASQVHVLCSLGYKFGFCMFPKYTPLAYRFEKQTRNIQLPA